MKRQRMSQIEPNARERLGHRQAVARQGMNRLFPDRRVQQHRQTTISRELHQPAADRQQVEHWRLDDRRLQLKPADPPRQTFQVHQLLIDASRRVDHRQRIQPLARPERLDLADEHLVLAVKRHPPGQQLDATPLRKRDRIKRRGQRKREAHRPIDPVCVHVIEQLAGPSGVWSPSSKVKPLVEPDVRVYVINRHDNRSQLTM